METVLTVVWYVATIGGVLLLALALSWPELRRPLLIAAAAALAVSGILSIVSIGAVFLVLAALAGVGAARTSPPGPTAATEG